jgi:ABC-2 type transport system ATP-binding protein
MSDAIRVKSIFKHYKQFSLENISFELPTGYIMGLVGPNGAGKTTIIKAIMNAINLNGGTIEVLGFDSVSGEIQIKESTAYIADSIYFSDTWTAKDVQWIMEKTYQTFDKTKYLNYLERYRLPVNKPIREFSSGMKTKLMLAVAFSRETKLLLLDEPTSGLDPMMRDEFLSEIKEYIRDGSRSVLYSTHITTDLEKTADYITFINAGCLVFSKDTDTLRESYLIVKDGLNAFEAVKDICIGYKTNEYGFEALIERKNANRLSPSCVKQPASIEDIVVFSSLKGGQTREI